MFCQNFGEFLIYKIHCKMEGTPTFSGELNHTDDIISNSYSSDENIHDLNREIIMWKLPALIYMAILIIIGLPGNLSVFVVFLRQHKHSTYRTFVLALAFIDIVACSVCMPFDIIETTLHYIFYVSEICKIFRGFAGTVYLTSGFIIIGLSVDRYRHVCHPFKTQMSVKISRIICVSSIIVALVFSLPSFFLYGIRQVNLKNNITGSDCSMINDDVKSTNYQFYNTAVKFSMFIMTIVSIIIMYILIGHTVYKQAHFRKKFCPTHECNDTQRKDNSGESTTLSGGNSSRPMPMAMKEANSLRNDRQSKERVTKIAFAISVLLILSFLPYFVIAALWKEEGDIIDESLSVTSSILAIFTRSVYMNSVGNPFVYGLLDKRFRKFLKTNFCRWK